jgi:hypothetical protein
MFLVDNFIASSIEKFIQLGKEEKCDESLLGILDKINNLPLRFLIRNIKETILCIQ